MLEIKTTSIDSFVYKKDNEGCLTMQKDNNGLPIIKAVKGKLNSWFVNSKIYVPKDYKLQLGLYLYLRKQNKGLFAISFLKAIDYAKPELFDPFKSEIKFVNVDYDLNQFQEYIDFATK
jgi:hypothetical protein